MLSFNDIYRMLAIIMLILVPGFILLRRSGGARGGSLIVGPSISLIFGPELGRAASFSISPPS